MSKETDGDLFIEEKPLLQKPKKLDKVPSTMLVAPQPAPGTPAALLTTAIQSGLSIEHLERLIGLQNQWEAKEARKEFFHALSNFQMSVPEIKKTKKVGFEHRDGGGKTEYFYATLSDICNSIREPLSHNGLSYRWEIDDQPEKITVTCIITHADGHAEKTTMVGQADNSGKKNLIQQRASTVTYLQRYTLIGALGISSADMDNDGQSGSKDKGLKPINAKQFDATLTKVMNSETTLEKVKGFFTLTEEQEKALQKAEAATKHG